MKILACDKCQIPKSEHRDILHLILPTGVETDYRGSYAKEEVFDLCLYCIADIMIDSEFYKRRLERENGGGDPVLPAKIDVCPECGSDSKKKRVDINLDSFNAWFPCQDSWHKEEK
jgi:hypothetical protein